MQIQRNELNLKGQNIYVGLDVHLKSWTACVMTEDSKYIRFTQPPDAAALYKYLCRNYPDANYYSAYEAGFSGFWAHRQLESLGIHNTVVHAADVPTKQKERMQKDDPADSRKLAHALRSKNLDAIHVPTAATSEDRALVRMRFSLVKDMTRHKSRAKSMLYFFGIRYPERFENNKSHWSKNFIQWLKQEVQFTQESGKQALNLLITEVEEQRKILLQATRHIRKLAETDKYAANVKLLKSIPGIGLVTAMAFLTEMESVERFKNTDHFAGYVGLTPDRHNSGDKKNNGEMTCRGQKILKKCIIEAAWIAIRKDPVLTLAYNKLAKDKSNQNKAIIRIARKLLNRMYSVLKSKIEYVYGVIQ